MLSYLHYEETLMSAVQRDLVEALRKMKLEEARLRSAALAFSLGLTTQEELNEAAHNYGQAARFCKWVEQERLRTGKGVAYTTREAEMMR